MASGSPGTQEPYAQQVGQHYRFGLQPHVNQDVLKQITKTVLLMRDVTAENMRAFFQWVSASVQVASISATGAGIGEAQANLPPPPTGIQVVL